MKAGIATAARIPMIATTIINSMRVNPRLACLMSFICGTQSNVRAAANCLDLRQEMPRRAEECHLRGEKRPARGGGLRKLRGFQSRLPARQFAERTACHRRP